jgi:hypothetical protein
MSSRRRRPRGQARQQNNAKRLKAKTVLLLPDLEQAKRAVLDSLVNASCQESYCHAIDEFIGWYCSESRLVFNRTVVLRYRFFLEQNNLAPSKSGIRSGRASRKRRRQTPPALPGFRPADAIFISFGGPHGALRRQSTCASRQSGVWRTKRRIPAF